MPAAQSILMKLMLSISKMDSSQILPGSGLRGPRRSPPCHRAGCPCPSPAEHMWLYAFVPDPKQSGWVLRVTGGAHCLWTWKSMTYIRFWFGTGNWEGGKEGERGREGMQIENNETVMLKILAYWAQKYISSFVPLPLWIRTYLISWSSD